jgi:hypothetical protein
MGNVGIGMRGILMVYANARKLIQSGDIICFTHRRLRSWYDLQVMLVRWATASKYSHVGIAYRMDGRVWLLEAVTPLVRMVPLSHFAEEGFDVLSMKRGMSGAEREAAIGQVGVARYSRWQAVLGFLRRLKFGRDALTQCCEYVIVHRRMSGVDLGPVATPAAVVDKALQSGAKCWGVHGL